MALGDKPSAKLNFEAAHTAAHKIEEGKQKVLTLIQLSEDQREELNFQYAHIFLEEANIYIEKEAMTPAEKDKAYTLLTENYAKLFDLKRAKLMMNKVSNPEKKVLLDKLITLIEQQSALTHSI
ncbi:MAG: hypothetical protein KAH22_06270 [Thiotrichaceae bacterium]|nr:hypothetical protein [Thiotrichaceae bacterium]